MMTSVFHLSCPLLVEVSSRCRELDYVIRFGGDKNSPGHYIINWCKTTDSDWKIVEVPKNG